MERVGRSINEEVVFFKQCVVGRQVNQNCLSPKNPACLPYTERRRPYR